MLANSLTPVALYDVEADHWELYNQLGKQPEVERELREAFIQFHAARVTGGKLNNDDAFEANFN